jgi:prophage regulatory protein
MTDRFLRLRDVTGATGCSRTAIYDGMKAGTFPLQISVGNRSVVWMESEIEAWMQGKIAQARSL